MTNVVGLFETRDQARRAIEALKAAGFKAEDIGLAMRDPSLAEEVAADVGADHERAPSAPRRPAAACSAG